MKMKNWLQSLCTVMSDDITKCQKLFSPFKTYLVSGARIRDPRPYLVRVGTFEWIVDSYTIIAEVTNEQANEAPLPPPRKLNALPFSEVQLQLPGAEFDLLTVVANCSSMQYSADQTKRYREAIVMDKKSPLIDCKKPSCLLYGTI